MLKFRRSSLFSFSMPRGLSLFAAIVGIFMAQSACIATEKVVKWTEEVQLSNGQMIVVERETHHRPGGAELARGSGWRPQQYTIRFKYPSNSTQVIEWRSTKMDSEGAYQPEFPLVLDIEPTKNVPQVVTINWLRGACYEYVRYVYRDNVWSEDPLPAEFEARDANLYLPAAGLDLPNRVSLELKRRENDSIGYRKRLKQIGPKQTACGA